MDDAQIIERPEIGTEVAILGTVTAVTVFGTEGGVDAILEKIRAQARAVETDISTPAGRAAVASLAYKIARSKTALDGMGKELGEANFRAWKAITAERARIETELDALRDEVRKPLTDWEKTEKARVAAHEAALDAICEAPSFFDAENTAADLRQRLAYLEQYPRRDWQEFSKRAADALEREIAKTKVALAVAEKREDEVAEAARLAQEKLKRELAAREALIAANARREAEEKARRVAEAEARRVEAERRAAEERAAAEAKAAADKARREREAVEAEKAVAEARARKAEEDRIAEAKAAEAERARIEREREEANKRADEAEAARLAATAKARADMERAAADAEVARKKAAEDAAAAERQRIADAQAKDAADTAAREANRRHRAQINGEARDALVKEGLSEPAATTAITAIAKGAVPHIAVRY